MQVVWKMIFKLEDVAEAQKLERWLRANLKEPYRFKRVGRSIFIYTPSMDEAFKVGQWVRYNNPLGRLLDYTVIAEDWKHRIVWASYCRLCRAGHSKPHYEHRMRKVIGEQPL